MRRVVVVLVLLGAMLGLKMSKAAPMTVGDPLTLAAIGFVVLAAFTIAEVLQLLKLPRVSGYILTGIVLGPSATNILSASVVEEMRIFNTLALGLIATSAGLELDLRALARVYKTLISSAFLKVLLVFPSVAALFYVLEKHYGFLGVTGAGLIGLSLLIGTFAVGTSPSVSLAVLSETKAKGRLSDLVLGAAVFKDLVVVVLLAIDVAVINAMLSGGDMDRATVASHIATELGYTTLVGAALGVLLILYIRFVHAEMLLLVAAMIMVVAELSKVLHLELLLVFIVAGFVVRNFSRYEHELSNPLQMVSLPVFVVFFTIAGASVNLHVLLTLLPLALALAVLRASGFWVISRAGGALGGENDSIKRTAWLGYLPLAGVTLGLIGLASQRIPALSAEIVSLGMAFVSINLLVGPVTLRYALAKVGEVPDARLPERTKTIGMATTAVAPTLDSVETELTEARESLRHPELADVVDGIERELETEIAELWQQTLQPHASALSSSALAVVSDEEPDLAAVRRFAEETPASDFSSRAARLEALFAELDNRLRTLPTTIEVPQDRSDRRVLAGDSFATRWRKRRRTLSYLASFGRARGRRHVPVRMLARTTLELNLANLCIQTLGAWSRAHAAMVEALRAWVGGEASAAETRAAIEGALQTFRDRHASEVRFALAQGLGRFARLADRAGGPALPARQVRYSSVEPQVRAALSELRSSAGAWENAVRAAQHTLSLWVELGAIDRAIDGELSKDVLSPLSQACDESIPHVERVRDRIAALTERVEADSTKLAAACREAFPSSVQAELRQTRARFARTATGRDLALALRELVDRLPVKLTVLRPGMSVHSADNPRSIAVRQVNPRQLADQKLIGDLLPVVDSVIADVSTRIAIASPQIRDAVDAAIHALESGPTGGDSADPELARKGLTRAVERLELLRKGLEEAAARTRQEMAERVRNVQAELRSLAIGQPSTEAGLARAETISRRALRGLADRVRPLWRQVQGTYRQIVTDFQRFYGSELSRDIQIRYARTALDAGAIRSYVSEWRENPQLPQGYGRLFALEPLRDRRFFLANQAELSNLLAAERAWLEDGPSSALVVGRHGSGMTSILNLCGVELGTRRVLRPDWKLARREGGILPVLADDLGCEPRKESLMAALTAQRTLVLIDDLQSWFLPNAAGITDLEEFLEVIVETRHRVFWIVTVELDALSVMEEAFSVRQAFGHVVQLSPLTPDQAHAVINARHRLSPFDVEYPKSFASQLLGRFKQSSERDVFFRVLSRVTEGNLRLILIAWRRAVTRADGVLTPSLPRLLGLGLPFISLLPPRPASMLVQLLRFGPMDAERLGIGSGLMSGEALRNASFLQSAGLVEAVAPGRDELRIPELLQESVLRGLREAGAVRGGAPK